MSDDFDAIVGDIDDELDLTLYADAAELAEEVTVQILAAIEKGLKLKSQFHLVLTGGTLGVQISEALVNEFNADVDAPTRPFPSPTTVSAVKENIRPPLTVFATRLT